MSAAAVGCDGCGDAIPDPTEDHRRDGLWFCHNCRKAALYGRGPMVEILMRNSKNPSQRCHKCPEIDAWLPCAPERCPMECDK